MQELCEAYYRLMGVRSGDSWVTLTDIKLYMEMFPVRFPESFPLLMMSAQRANFKAQAEQKKKIARANERKAKLKE